MAKRKSASESLEKLSRGLTRETPQTRPQEPENVESGEEVGERGSESSGAVSGRMQRPGRKVRVSVDLPRSEHKYLRDYAYDHDSDAMSVMRALLQEMAADENLAIRVGDRLARE